MDNLDRLLQLGGEVTIREGSTILKLAGQSLNIPTQTFLRYVSCNDGSHGTFGVDTILKLLINIEEEE